MADTTALLRLMSWLSPVFPTGSFAYSAGLEQAVVSSIVTDALSLKDWIEAQLKMGSLWNDAVFFVQVHKNAEDPQELSGLAAHAIALNSAAQRRGEMLDQGASFLIAAASWIEPSRLPPKGTPLALCVGAAAGMERIACTDALAAYLHAFTTNQLQAAIRLSVIGQKNAAHILATIEPDLAAVADKATKTDLDDLGTATVMADIVSMQHETLQPRLFRS